MSNLTMRARIFFNLGFFLLFFAVLAVVFIYFSGAARAALPVEAGLGETCDASVPCDSRFFCSVNEAGSRCVQCEDYTNCDENLNETCNDGICTLPGGNNAGDLCAGNSNCKSGSTCGARGVCEETGTGFRNAFNYTCQDTQDCANGLICSSGKCVQCATANSCTGNVSACDQGVCVLTGGNPEGAWCTKGTHCVSGECSSSNLCLAGAEPTGKTASGSWMGMDLSIQDVVSIINGLACWLTRIATAIMVIFLVIAGMRFMYARGNPVAYQSAVKNFQQVLIGIVVIMAVYVIIATVANAVGVTNFSLIPLVC